jgi:cysteinyl-tRNA synthetase
MAKGLAYEHQGDVYFSVENFPGYGKLSGQPLEELVSGARVEVEEGKRHPADFALWKSCKNRGSPPGRAPGGRGGPVGILNALSCPWVPGGNHRYSCRRPRPDFPHHENEVAQSEGATGKPFARYWLHAGYLNINQEKMSKSLGNFLTVREMRKTVNPQVVRFFMLSAQYRSPINFSQELLQAAENGLHRLQTMVANVQDRLGKLTGEEGVASQDPLALRVRQAKEDFVRAMDDDFNTADGIAALFELAREVNSYLNKASRIAGPGPWRKYWTFTKKWMIFWVSSFPRSRESSLEKMWKP